MAEKPPKEEKMPPEKDKAKAKSAEKTASTDSDTKEKKGSATPLKIFYHWCKACNICIAFCPKKVFEPDRDGKPIIAHPYECTQCAFCWMHCPDMAIVSTEK